MRRLYAVPAWAWFLVALAVRLGFALKLGGRFIQTDEIGYAEPARQLLDLGVIGTRGVARIVPPLPAVFYAFFFSIGKNLLAPRLGLAILGLLNVWLVSQMTRALTNSRGAAHLALAIATVYPFFIYYGGAVMSESLFITALCWALWMLGATLADGGRSKKLAALAGLAWALAALVRPQALPTAVVVWAVLGREAYLKNWRRGAFWLCLVCWAAPLLLWAARNKVMVGRFAVDAHGGVSMLHGTKYFEQNEIDTGVAMEAIRASPTYKQSLQMSEADGDKLFMAEAFAWMKENPGQTVKLWARKFGKFWRPYPRRDKVYTENEHSRPTAGFPRWALVAMSLAFEPWLILLGFWGLWERRRERRLPLLPAWIFILVTTGIHTVVVSTMRYRLPVMPILIMGAAAWLARRIGEPRRADR